jgi:hypothetical protein
MIRRLLFILFVLTTTNSLISQKVLDAKDNVKEMAAQKDQKEGWTKAGGIGLNMNLLNMINPRIGAGDNQVGLGGILNYGANLLQGKVLWDNKFLLQLATVKIAGDAWTKANDVMQATSQWGYQLGSSGKWYGAGLADFQTQFLPTYGAKYLKEQTIAGKKTPLDAKFLAPAIFKFAPGVIYKHSSKLKVLYSPIAVKAVIVANDEIAKQARFIPLEKETDPNSFKKTDFQIGSELRFDYTSKFFEDKVIYTSTLDLYSNYLREPQNVDVEWYNSLDFVIMKNISVNFRTDWFYDHDIKVLRGGDATKVGRDIFIRNALLLKYNRLF